MRRQTLGWSLCNVGVKPSIHPPVTPITSQHEERWGEVGSPPMWTPFLLVATLSKDSFLLWHGTPGYKPSQRSPWWHYLELTVFSAWALAQILLKKKAVPCYLQSLHDLNICTEGQPTKWSQQAPKDQHLMLFVWLAGSFSSDKGVRLSSGHW